MRIVQLFTPVIIKVTTGIFLEVFTEVSIGFELENNNISILNSTFKSDLRVIVCSLSSNLSSNPSENISSNTSENISENIPKNLSKN
jgi:hypothetical protein